MEASASATRTDFEPRIPLTLLRLGDERLAQLVAAGHVRAFALLYERYHQPLYRYLRSMLGQDADAQDALQSTFASAFGALEAGRRKAPLRPWLFRIAHNEAISSLRRRRAHAELADGLASSARSPEEQVIERERLRLLVADLAELSDRQRGALVMRELSGLPHEDIARVLEISVGAAKQTVFEARRALLELEEGRAMPCEEIQRVISDGDMRALRGRKVRAHLRGCSGCAAFAASIRSRRMDLLALSPALPPAIAAGLFARIVRAAPGHASGGGGLAAGMTGKATGVAISAKAIVGGVAVLAATTIGTAGVLHQVTSAGHASRSRIARPTVPGSASGAPARSAGAGAPAGVLRSGGPPRLLGGAARGVRAANRTFTQPPTALAAGGVPRKMAAPSPRVLAPGRVVSQSAGARGGPGMGQTISRSTSSSHGRGSSVGVTHAATKSLPGSSRRAAKPMGTPPAARAVGAPSSRGVGRAAPPVPVTANAPAARASGAASLPPAPAGSRPAQP